MGAVKELREAVSLDPDMGYAWCYLSAALNSLQPPDLKGAEEAARESIRLQPIYSWSYVTLASALELQGRYEEATAALEYALELNPDFRDACVYLGEIQLGQGNYDQALTEFNRARAMEETPYLLVQISAAYAGRGDKEESLAELEKALGRGYRDFADLDSNPYFDSLRADPRFAELLQRINIPESQGSHAGP